MPDIYKLDRKKPFGTVTGDPNIGFIQDGNSYRHDGTLFAKSGMEPPVPPAGYGTIPPADAVETLTSTATDVQGLEEALESQRRKERSDAMRRIWAARKEQTEKRSR